MIIFDYFVYRFIALFRGRKVNAGDMGVGGFITLFCLNVYSILDSIFEVSKQSTDIYRYILLIIVGVSLTVSLWYYNRKGRYERIYSRFCKERRIQKILGWIAIIAYVLLTFYFMGNH